VRALLVFGVDAYQRHLQAAPRTCKLPTGTVTSVPADVSCYWNGFFEDWVRPVTNFGIPTLIVFAILITLSVMATPLLVGKETPGIRSAEASKRRWLSGAYWFGILCLLFSAVEATMAYPAARYAQGAALWPTCVAIGLIVAAIVPFFSPLWTAGRKRRKPWRLISLISFYAFDTVILIVIGTAIALVIISHFQHVWPEHWSWVKDQYSHMAYAVLLALLGVGIVGRVRGIGIGMLIQGHDKNGTDDAGLAAFVQARLYAMGSHEPSGILITQQTDVSSLPSEALSLIPDGTLAKLAALFASLFSPPTPWRVDVAEQSDGSVVVSIRRNGKVTSAAAIRASRLGLPAQRSTAAQAASDQGSAASGAGGAAGAAGTSPTGSPATADWTAELRTAAAAFILLTLADRYEHLKNGLSGATRWRSVAMQVIATDPASQLSPVDQRALLAGAIAEDAGNNAAKLAELNVSYRMATSQSDQRKFAEKFKSLLEKVDDDKPTEEPFKLRLRFNLMVVWGNYATSLAITKQASDAGSTLDAAIKKALHDATEQAENLLKDWAKTENQNKFPELYQAMYAAVYYAARAINAEWERHDNIPRIECVTEEHPQDINMTLLARYENACALTRNPACPGKAEEYERALDELEIAVTRPSQRDWARTDPSLAELHDVDIISSVLRSVTGRQAPSCQGTNPGLGQSADVGDPEATAYQLVTRFKRLIGDPVPADFLALPPFAKYQDALGQRGIHDARQLIRAKVSYLVSELGITAGEAGRWLELAKLHRLLARAAAAHGQAKGNDESDKRATQLTFLLLKENLDSVGAVRDALRNGQLRDTLLNHAGSSAVAAPGNAEVEAWCGAWRPKLPCCR
jgi:hypothetical protein